MLNHAGEPNPARLDRSRGQAPRGATGSIAGAPTLFLGLDGRAGPGLGMAGRWLGRGEARAIERRLRTKTPAAAGSSSWTVPQTWWAGSMMMGSRVATERPKRGSRSPPRVGRSHRNVIGRHQRRDAVPTVRQLCSNSREQGGKWSPAANQGGRITAGFLSPSPPQPR